MSAGRIIFLVDAYRLLIDDKKLSKFSPGLYDVSESKTDSLEVEFLKFNPIDCPSYPMLVLLPRLIFQDVQ